MAACVLFAAFLLQASLTTLTIAHSEPSWIRPYLRVYPPVSADEDAGGTKSLYFALTMSFGGIFKSSGTIPGVEAALDRINSDPTLLPGYKLHYTLTDSQCNRRVALDAFFNQIAHYPTKIAWIGSGCSIATTPTAEVSHQYNITQLSCISASPELGDRQCFRYYFQMLASTEQLGIAFYGIVKQFQWKRVTIIEQNENVFTVTTARLKGLLTQAGITFTSRGFNTEEGIEGLGLEPFGTQSRIFVMAMYSPYARQLMCKAYLSGMRYPSYMFLTFASYAPRWWERMTVDDECTPEERESVLLNMLAPLHFQFLTDLNATTDTGINGYQYNSLYKAHQVSSPLDVGQNRTNDFAQHCYDATWALAFALNKTITELEENSTLNADIWEAAGLVGSSTFPLDNFSYNNSALLDVIFKQVQETNFKGISGSVSFGAAGIRQATKETVYQYRYIDGVLQQVEIGNVLAGSEDYPFVFLPGVEDNLWPGGIIPHDGVPVEEDVTVAIPITVIFSILAIAGITFSVVCLAFNCIFRKAKLIRLSSPNLNYLIGGGAIILYMDIYFFIIPTADPKAVAILCNITPWLTALGYSLCYGTILAKMVRVYSIFNKPTLKKKIKLQDWHLAIGVLMLVVVDLVILIAYNIVSGVQESLTASRVLNRENPMNVNGVLRITTLYFTYVCNSTARDISLGILYGYKMVLQIIALVLAFSIRKVKVKGLNDAKYIAAAVYVTSIVLAVILISTYTLTEFVNGFVAVVCTGNFIGTTFILGLVFVPKMVNLYKDPDGETVFPFKPSSNLSHRHSSVRKEHSSDVQTVINLKERIAELEAAMSQMNKTRTSSPEEIKRSHVIIADPDSGGSYDSTEDTNNITDV